MSDMRFYSLAIFITALAIAPSNTHAQSVEAMTVRSLALDESGDGLAVQIDAGILLVDEGDEVTFLCSSAWQAEGAQADWLVQTGVRRPLIAGPNGPFLGLESGCEWARTSGPVDSARVVGVHTPQPGGQVVLFAVTSAFSPDEVLRTDDGGFTSSSSGGFAQLDKILRGLVGDGDSAILIGEDVVTGKLMSWRSEDGGQSFEEISLDANNGDELLGLGGETVWFGNDSAVTAYDLLSGSELIELTLESSLTAYAVQSTGAIWFATSDGRLHHRDPHTDDGESYEQAATAIAVRGEHTWVGLRAEQPGDPLIRRLDPGETQWVEVAIRPTILGYPEGCETHQAQTCAEDSRSLLPPVSEEPDPVPPATPNSEGGCTGGSKGGSLPLELAVFLLALGLVARLRVLRRNGSPAASP